MIVYHYSNEYLRKFVRKSDNYFSKFKQGTKSAIFFTDNARPKKKTTLDRKYQITADLNIRSIKIIKATKSELHAKGTDFTSEINRAYLEGLDCIRFIGIDDNQEIGQNITVVFNPEKIKIINVKKIK
jgi:hypothetical protein